MVRRVLQVALHLAERLGHRAKIDFGLGQIADGGFELGQAVTETVDIRHAQRGQRG